MTNRAPKIEFEEDLRWKDEVHKVRMKEIIEDDVNFSNEPFLNSLQSIKKKGGDKYKFIVRAGQAYLAALFKLYKIVWKKEKKPDSWKNTVLIQLEKKGKKDKTDLDSRRHIHTKEEPQKFFSKIVTDVLKPNLFKELSPFQIGAVSGHRSQEHLFVIKSFVTMVERFNEAVAIQQFDYMKMFDKEALPDCMNELYKLNVKGKLFKLVYELNKDRRIKVRTAVGDSRDVEISESLGQGTSEGAIVSTNSISNGVRDFFGDREFEVSYGPLVLSPIQFVDDLSRFSSNPTSAQMGNDRLESLAESKLLDYNMNNTVIIILGKKKARESLLERFEEDNPTIYGKKVKSVKEETHLGDQLGISASESISLTIKKRIGLVKRGICEIIAVV